MFSLEYGAGEWLLVQPEPPPGLRQGGHHDAEGEGPREGHHGGDIGGGVDARVVGVAADQDVAGILIIIN